MHSNEDFQGDQQAFVDEVRQLRTTGGYTTPEDLAAGVTNRLTRIAAEDLSPWCKLGDAIFRAHAVADTGQALTVHATVTDDAALAALESLRPGGWSGHRDTRLTYAGRSHGVRVTAITTKTTSSRGTGLEITLQYHRDDGCGPMSFSFSVNDATYSADDITEIDLRSALFGEARRKACCQSAVTSATHSASSRPRRFPLSCIGPY